MKYLHPLNITTYMIGLCGLLLGSLYAGAPDWDIPVSIIMSVFCYAFATETMLVILNREWAKFPIMMLLTWWTVDGCYALYWHYVNPSVLEMSRQANWPASLALYGFAGIIWLVPSVSENSQKTVL